jgi:hypothetical protein
VRDRNAVIPTGESEANGAEETQSQKRCRQSRQWCDRADSSTPLRSGRNDATNAVIPTGAHEERAGEAEETAVIPTEAEETAVIPTEAEETVTTTNKNSKYENKNLTISIDLAAARQ